MNQQGAGGAGGGPFAPAFNVGGFINDPTTAMGIQVGKTAMAAGQEYMEQNVSYIRDLWGRLFCLQ